MLFSSRIAALPHEIYFIGPGMSHSLKHEHILAVGLDGFVSVSAASGEDCWREDYRFLQHYVFLDVTSQCLSIRAGNIESLPKSVTTNGCNDLAGGGGLNWCRERHTQAHTVYLHIQSSMEVNDNLRIKNIHRMHIYTHSLTNSHFSLRHSCLPPIFYPQDVCVCMCLGVVYFSHLFLPSVLAH